jgi:hypothetical protein
MCVLTVVISRFSLFSSGRVCLWWGDYLKKEVKRRSNRDSPEQASVCWGGGGLLKRDLAMLPYFLAGGGGGGGRSLQV